MKVNLYLVKKFLALSMAGMMPFLFFLMFLTSTHDLIMSFLIATCMIPIMVAVGSRLLRHSYSAMVEGTGIQTFIIDSRGVMGSFISTMRNPPRIQGRIGKAVTDDLYERELIHTMVVPKKGNLVKAVELDGNGEPGRTVTVLKMPEPDSHGNLFSFDGKPTFIYNKNLDMYVAKDMLSKMEMGNTTLHAINHLRNMTSTLSKDVAPFVKYIVELTRPVKKWFEGKMKIILIIIAILVILFFIMLFLPGLMGGITQSMGGLMPRTNIP